MIQEYRTIKVEIQNNVLCIVLNRPDKRNALNQQMVKELHTVFRNYEKDDTIFGVSLTGAGRVFCAGADLAYLKSLSNKSFEENLQDSRNLKDMYWSIYNFPKPTVALVNGPAIAGGCGLMNVFDFAFANEQASFGYPEVKIGFIASIVSVFLIQTIGLQRAKELLLTGRILDAWEAQKIGLIHRVLKNNELSDASNHFFKELQVNSPQAMSATKEMLHNQSNEHIERVLEELCLFNAKSRQTDDFKEGLLSFLEKRKPIWRS